MVTSFTCIVDGCPNEGVEYRLTDAHPVTTCGGCGIVLEGVSADE
jgi:hypothetical protein